MMRDYSVIGGETITIRRTNPRTPVFIFVFAANFIFFPLMLLSKSGTHTPPWFLFLMLPVIAVLVLRVWGLMTTITIGPDGVRYKSLSKEFMFPWKDIKVAGIYVTSRNAVQVLKRYEFNETHYLRLKYVWFSLSEWGQPATFTFPGMTYADFEYRKDAWELFNKYLSANPDPNKLPGFDRYVMGESQRNHWMH